MVKKALIAAALLAAVIPLSPTPVQAAGPADHCVQHVTGQQPSGELTVSAPRCYSTFEEAMQAEHVTAWGDGAARQAAGSGVAMASFTLATHYDYTNFNPAGGSTSTVGTGCTGGWLNTSAAWNNRIGSTHNGCPNVYHFDGVNLTGSFAVTVGQGGNLGVMNNRTSSIQYA